MSNKFISGIMRDVINYKKWITFFDWIFDEQKFDGWQKGDFAKYTSSIKQIEGFKENKYFIKAKDIRKAKYKDSFFIAYSKNGSESKSLVKHIRNSIAHGNAKLRTIAGVRSVELNDKYHGKETAHIVITEKQLQKIYNLYTEVSKNI